jgi:hypothetical protein
MMVAAIACALVFQPVQPVAACVDLKGRQVIPLDRSQEPKPAATVLIFYLAQCPISQKLTPEINRLYREFEPQGVRFFLVHEDLSLTNAQVRKEARSFGLLPPIVIDKWRRQVKLSGASISPEACIYDRDFRLVYRGRLTNLFYDLGRMRPRATKRDAHEALTQLMDGKKLRFHQTPAVGCILPKS